ncbi:hypothetical protein THTE_3176 [Thermogutta terrifontis]|uniref:Uncharacterized protein n=1 Tax=Thermogutta terrifontis TaxID=1331910 RepID=A0A286RII9_9BACT|nr:hypothetical protein THTE_3176 [Thermogutta terrifontis]
MDHRRLTSGRDKHVPPEEVPPLCGPDDWVPPDFEKPGLKAP